MIKKRNGVDACNEEPRNHRFRAGANNPFPPLLGPRYTAEKMGEEGRGVARFCGGPHKEMLALVGVVS